MTPNHIAIILDGNRRFAKKLMVQPWKGHEYGKDKLKWLIEECIKLKVKELTLYTFSLQNFNRPKEEFDYLMKLFKDGFVEFYDDPRIVEHQIKVNVIGRYNLFPADVVESMNRIMEKTKNHKGLIINFAMAYGGREELVDAVKKLLEEHKNGAEINEAIIAEKLYISSEPDIIIRTGGEKRTSNFLAWQSIYSEWFFLDKTWPEFDKTDFEQVLLEYSQRERRFGK